MREDALPRHLNGFWHLDDSGGEIFINAAVPKVQKHLTLLHELVHIAEEKPILGRLIHRRSGEQRVPHLAISLFGMIATSGLWRGVSPREVEHFYARMVRLHRARARKGFRTKRNRRRRAR